MKRTTLKRLTAVWLAAMMLTGLLVPASAEEADAQGGQQAQTAPGELSADAEDLEQDAQPSAVTQSGNTKDPGSEQIAMPSAPVKVTAVTFKQDGSVLAELTCDKGFAVKVTLSSVLDDGTRAEVQALKLKAGTVSALFQDVAPGNYEVTAIYTGVPGQKASVPFAVTVPVPTPEPTAVPTPEPTAEPTQEPTPEVLEPVPEQITQPQASEPVGDMLPQTVFSATLTVGGDREQNVDAQDPAVGEETPVADDSAVQPEGDAATSNMLPDTFSATLTVENGVGFVQTGTPEPTQAPAVTESVPPILFDATPHPENIVTPDAPAQSETPPTAEETPVPETPTAQPTDSGTLATPVPSEQPTPVPPIIMTGPEGEVADSMQQGVMLMSMPQAVGGTVTGKIYNSTGKALLVKLKKNDAADEMTQTIDYVADTTEYVYSFSNVTAGSYTLSVSYKDENMVLLTAQVEVGSGSEVTTAISYVVSTGFNSLSVTVQMADKKKVMVELYKDGNTKMPEKTGSIDGGTGTVKFEGLAAGTYAVCVYYEATPKGAIEGSYPVKDLPIGIVITSVAAGENKLVVSGTAQPNADVTLTTTPDSITHIAHANEKGIFTAEMAVAAGTYTQIHAQYGSDTSSRVSISGSYVVTSAAVAPQLTVDPVTTGSLIVYASTSPGVTVDLSTGDFTQTRVADSRGILTFSLPHTYPFGTVFTFTVHYGANNVQTFQVQKTVTGAAGYRLLKKGTSGEDVRALTQRLHDLGYPVNVTSSYDEGVAAAVRLFQGMNGLSVDGMAGVLTQTTLFSIAAIRYNEIGIYPTLVRGDRGLASIYTLQQRLKDLGYYTIRVDGIFGSGTERAVREFQRRNGLTVTGRADNATQQLLYSFAAKPSDWYSSSNEYKTLSRSGRYNAAVVPLQRRLRNLGYYTGSIDGYFGSKTYKAVRNFQSRNGIKVTGVADGYTQSVLYASDAKPASGTSSSGSSSGYKLLYWGCKGDAVRILQQALWDAGYSKQVRAVDGIYGQWTYDAVRAFQKDRGLAVDGIAGKNTQNALYGTNY